MPKSKPTPDRPTKHVVIFKTAPDTYTMTWHDEHGHIKDLPAPRSGSLVVARAAIAIARQMGYELTMWGVPLGTEPNNQTQTYIERDVWHLPHPDEELKSTD